MTDTWLTVPTNFSRPSLWPLLEDCGVDPDHIVIVDTGYAMSPEQAHKYRVIFEPSRVESPNIQQWWNRGIDYAKAHGGDVCIVVNDDVKTFGSLEPLAQACRDADATIAAPIHGLCGWLFALNLRHDVRPNEQYQWWYGDNDLYIRANTQGRGVVVHNLPVKHLNEDPGKLTGWQAILVKEDQALFEKQWGAPV